MWFDAKAKLLEIERLLNAKPAKPAKQEADQRARFSSLATLAISRASNPVFCPDALDDFTRDHFEERAAIREYDGGQGRAEAEAAAWAEAKQSTAETYLDEWRREADDIYNPEAWP